ncbi:MAG: hypothetical protein KAS72_11735 [Phycisphaerales bacterium]|nr:hypothetical protein [Phycisphaerales bacterium]
MTQDRQAGRTAQCPRCGYDLRGEIQTWQDRCPMQGRCTECGLAFAWMDVFRQAAHPWLFEYHWRHKFIRSALRTLVMTLRPGRFWQHAKITDRIHLRPIVGIVVILLLAAYPIIVMHELDLLVTLLGRHGPGATIRLRGPLRLSSLLTTPDTNAGTILLVGWRAWICLMEFLFMHTAAAIMSLVMPISLVCAPATLRRAKVRVVHIVRIWAYSMFLLLSVWVLYIASWAAIDGVCIRHGVWPAAETLVMAYDPGNREFACLLDRPLDRLMGGTIEALVVGVWMWWWRTCACTRYLKIQQPRLAVALLTLISLLAGATVQALLL